MIETGQRPSLLAPLLMGFVALCTLFWGLKSASLLTLTQMLSGQGDAFVSSEVRALAGVVAITLLELVLAFVLALGRWQISTLSGLGLGLLAIGVILGQVVVQGPYWALALLGLWLFWEAWCMRSNSSVQDR